MVEAHKYAAHKENRKGSILAEIRNLGSQAESQLDFISEELWSRMNAPMGKETVFIPTFLMNEAQMDKIYPREWRAPLTPIGCASGQHGDENGGGEGKVWNEWKRVAARLLEGI